MKKNAELGVMRMGPILVLFCFSIWPRVGRAQFDLSKWKTATFGSISFKYPADWALTKSKNEKGMVFCVRPDGEDGLKAVEIIELEKNGDYCSFFKKHFQHALASRAHGEMKMLEQKDTILSDLPAISARVVFFYKTGPQPFNVFGVCGTKKFYIISIFILGEDTVMGRVMDRFTSAIFKTIVLEK